MHYSQCQFMNQQYQVVFPMCHNENTSMTLTIKEWLIELGENVFPFFVHSLGCQWCQWHTQNNGHTLGLHMVEVSTQLMNTINWALTNQTRMAIKWGQSLCMLSVEFLMRYIRDWIGTVEASGCLLYTLANVLLGASL